MLGGENLAENFDKMRRDALMRAREMYSRAKLPPYEFKDDPRDINLDEIKNLTGAEFSQNQFNAPLQGTNINIASKDEEFNLLINLINMLVKENADKSLIFALFYIIGF